MNSRDLLCAIAGTDESYVRESERFSAIAAEFSANRKKIRKSAAAAGFAAVFSAAVFGLIKLDPRSSDLFTPPETVGLLTTDGFDPSGGKNAAATSETDAETEETAYNPTFAGQTDAPSDETTEPRTQAPAAGRSRPGTQTQAPSRPGAVLTEPGTERPAPTDAPAQTEPEGPSGPPAETTAPFAEPTRPPEGGGEPGSPGAVFTNVSVGYGEAKEKFGHPIVPCQRADFTGYKVGIVSRDGDISGSGAFCLSVTYTFADGIVGLDDQDRWSSSSFSTYGEEYTYRGRTFYVQAPDAYRDYLHIGYWPTLDSGIGYQAHFGPDADVYEIMDLIISLEL